MRTTNTVSRMGRMTASAMRLGGALLLTAASAGLAHADDPQFSNDTMETRVTSPPPNIMFLHDNSGSMDWEFMAPEDEGRFDGNNYLWDLGNDDTYGSGPYINPLEWQGQWTGYNRIFYNPDTRYEPWPRWNKTDSTQDANGVAVKISGSYPPFNADLKTPRPNPIFRYAPLNLHSQYTSIPQLNAVVVNNNDGTPTYTSTNFSSSTTNTPSWFSNAGYQRSGTSKTGTRTATFTPNLTAGKYTVWAWWPCATDSDSNALITLNINGSVYTQRKSQLASTNNTVKAGFCGEWIPLFSTTLYAMPEGNKTSVSITRDSSSSNNSYTLADAVAFLPEGYAAPMEIISVRNAHYYMVNDLNGDGKPQKGEVYLVNFVWTDKDSDGKVEEGEVLRDYYLVNYDNDALNREDVMDLKKVSYNAAAPGSDAVPDAIQPKTYNDDGSVKGFVTDLADLQNFANWFSFYQRRELMTKAAVSRTLVKLDNVYMGYKTMHRDNTTGGANQPVLPIKVSLTVDPSVTSDNADSIGFTKSGSGWTTSTSRVPRYGANSIYTTTSGAWAQFQPTIKEEGLYKVSVWWPCRTASDKNAKITIVHKSGTEIAYYNQRASADGTVTEGANCKNTSAATGCCGYWVELGSYYFKTDNTGYVKIERHSGSTSSSQTAADAVQFQFVGTMNTTKVDQTNTLLDVIYRIHSADGTPLRQTLQKIGQYYDKDDGLTGSIGNTPYLTEAEGGACQHAYTVAMTDGYWNDSGLSPTLGNVDGSLGAPYADSYSNTLADVAAYYYNRDLVASLADEMPTSNYDKQKTQHMVTFAVSFGLDGKIKRDDINNDGKIDKPGYADDPYFLDLDTPKPVWPQPVADQASTIDDLWHSSINGHGRFFVANDPDSLVYALTETFADISSRRASGASVSVNGDELSEGLFLFQSSYSSGIWQGNVSAYPIHPDTGVVDKENPRWHANDVVQTQHWNTGRNIVTFNGSAGIPFRYDSLSNPQKKALENNAAMVDYLRGNEVTGFRDRSRNTGAMSSSLGDFVHSAPLLISAESSAMDKIDNDGDGSIDELGEGGGTLYVGGNDGMLHAFSAETGVERFAYVPFHSFAYLNALTKPDYQHRYYVDGRQQFKRINFLAGDQSGDGKDNDFDGCIDKTNTSCPAGKQESSNGDDENYSDGVDNDGDGQKDEPYEYKTVTMLVGMLNKGGRGLYALDVSNAESINPRIGINEDNVSSMVKWEYPPVNSDVRYAFVGNQTKDGIDNDGDGIKDEADENYSDGFDNNGDGNVDEADETALLSSGDDPDLGYTFGDAFIVRSYKSRYEAYPYKNGIYDPARNPWVVVFANGYLSRNGGAALYVVDAMTGALIRKIVADRSGNNGLSSPTVIDIDNDSRADFVYAGDLKGNMWKFDIRDPDPNKWGVSFGKDNYNVPNMVRIDYDDVDSNGNRDIPMPLVSIVNRPITTAPDVAFHPSKDKNGQLVVFGTGKFLGDADIHDNSQQGIFGVWDFGVTAKDYLGEWRNNFFTEPTAVAGFGSLPFAGVTLLEQKEIDWRLNVYDGSYLRTLSANKPIWDVNESGIPKSGSHVGWFFELPYLNSKGVLAGERVVKDVIIRSGRVIFISMIPGESSCSGGGNSIIHEVSLESGGRLTVVTFDVNNDGVIDDNDMIVIPDPDKPGQTILVPPTGMMKSGILHVPVIIKGKKKNKDELKYSSTSAGTTEMVREKGEEIGFYYWKEHVPQ